jgi:hypothetical protein
MNTLITEITAALFIESLIKITVAYKIELKTPIKINKYYAEY